MVFLSDWSQIAGFYDPGLYIQGTSKCPYLQIHTNSSTLAVVARSPLLPDIWQFITATWNYDILLNQTTFSIYVNGVISNSKVAAGGLLTTFRPISIGKNMGINFKGNIDEFSYYNRSLSPTDVATLFVMGPQIDPSSFTNYYNFKDAITNSSMLIHVDNQDTSFNNVALVTCTDFFSDNSLVFQTNCTATANVWTNLGHPCILLRGFGITKTVQLL